MIVQDRQNAIFDYIRERGDVTIGELASRFDQWSEMTLRRDLAKLAARRAVILTRGGAKYLPAKYGLSEDIYSERESRNAALKREIAEKAVTLVEPGMGIFIDSGTTAMTLAKLLPDVNLVVVTPAPSLALEVMSHKQLPSVVLLGGTLSRHTLSVSDPEAWRQLDMLNIDTAFIAASGFDKKTGFSVGSQLEGILKRSVISRARRVVVIADSSKLGSMLPFSFASFEDIDLLITDSSFPEELKEEYGKLVNIL